MPLISALSQMSSVARQPQRSSPPELIDGLTAIPREILDSVYTGWDSKNFPYGHLTQMGFDQLYELGQVIIISLFL